MQRYRIIAVMWAVKNTSIVQCHTMSCSHSYLRISGVTEPIMKEAFMPSHISSTDMNLFSNPFDLARQTRAARPMQYSSITMELKEIIIRKPKRLSALKAPR